MLVLKYTNFRSPPPSATIFSEPPLRVSKNFRSPPQYLHPPPCHIKWTFPLEREAVIWYVSDAIMLLDAPACFISYGGSLIKLLTGLPAKIFFSNGWGIIPVTRKWKLLIQAPFIFKIMDDDVECVQSLITVTWGFPEFSEKWTVKSYKSPPICHQFYEDKQRSRHLVPVAVNQLKIFRLPKKNGSSAGK